MANSTALITKTGRRNACPFKGAGTTLQILLTIRIRRAGCNPQLHGGIVC